MKVLSVQNSPCTRNCKVSEALRGRGHTVHAGFPALHVTTMTVGGKWCIGNDEGMVVCGWDGKPMVFGHEVDAGMAAYLVSVSTGAVHRAVRQEVVGHSLCDPFTNKCHRTKDGKQVVFKTREEADAEAWRHEVQLIGHYFDELRLFNNPHDVWDALGYYDVVLCHNFPDQMTSLVGAGPDVPMVAVWHDYYPITKNNHAIKEQADATKKCHAHAWVSPPQKRYADATYPWAGTEPYIYLPNYTSELAIERGWAEDVEKLPADEIHAVYMGGLVSGEDPSGEVNHYNLESVFRMLSGKGIHVHMLCNRNSRDYYRKLADTSKYLHWEEAVAAEDIVKALRRYHLGLCYLNKNEVNTFQVEASLPNKLFEYLAAGLPVATMSGATSIAEFIGESGCGVICEPEKLDPDPSWLQKIKVAPPDAYTYSGHIHELERLMEDVVH